MTGPHSPVNPDPAVTDPALVRAALARLLANERFRQAEAQARLLRFAVEESLAGRRSYARPASLAKLRASLAEYYAAEGLRDPLRMELPGDGSPAVFRNAAAPAAPRARRLWVWLPASLAAAAVLLWAGFWWHALTASGQIRSLAVLPLADLTAPNDGDWFAASLTGEIIDALGRVPGLHVVARATALQEKGSAARRLGVAAVLEGSVRRTGGRLRITLQMTRTSDGYRLWSANIDRPTRDLPAVEGAVAAAIAGRLQVRTPAPSSDRHRPSAEAYTAYLQGRFYFDRGDADALNLAAGRLEESTRDDPDFALAWAWLSIVREYRVAAGMARPNRAMPQSRDAAERALALDPDSGAAHLAMGIVKLQYDWDWAGAKEELDRALETSPGSAFAMAWRARWFESQGRMSEAISETGRALRLDPLSGAILSDAAARYVSCNQPQLALPFARKAMDLNPRDAAARAALANVLLLAGQKENARQVVEDLRNSGDAARLPPSVLASLSARLGDPQDARQLLDRAEDSPDEELLPAVAYAGLAAAIQDWDRLYSWTAEAYGERDVELPYWRSSPLVPKSDPRYDAFLAQMNLPAPAAH
jgi:TolB-like protein